MTNPPRAVIFDMDGVLVLTAEAHFISWCETGARYGVEITRSMFDRTFGRTNPDCIRELIDPDPTEAMIRDIADEKERRYRDLVRSEIPLAPGAATLLESLRTNGIAMAIGSSAPRDNLDLILDGASIRPYFRGVVDGSMVARGKPAPDVFLMAASLLGTPPTGCTVIEDAPAGIEAALAAGMWAIGLATTHPAVALHAAGARRVFGALADLTPDLVTFADSGDRSR